MQASMAAPVADRKQTLFARESRSLQLENQIRQNLISIRIKNCLKTWLFSMSRRKSFDLICICSTSTLLLTKTVLDQDIVNERCSQVPSSDTQSPLKKVRCLWLPEQKHMTTFKWIDKVHFAKRLCQQIQKEKRAEKGEGQAQPRVRKRGAFDNPGCFPESFLLSLAGPVVCPFSLHRYSWIDWSSRGLEIGNK